jgi:hypothetical protein
MTDARGRHACPNCWAARRLRSVALSAASPLQEAGDLVIATGGAGLLAAYLEALAEAGNVWCSSGHPVNVESLVERLRAGIIWS